MSETDFRFLQYVTHCKASQRFQMTGVLSTWKSQASSKPWWGTSNSKSESGASDQSWTGHCLSKLKQKMIKTMPSSLHVASPNVVRQTCYPPDRPTWHYPKNPHLRCSTSVDIVWQCHGKITVGDSITLLTQHRTQHTSRHPGTLTACCFPTDLLSGIRSEILMPLHWHLTEIPRISTRNYPTAVPWKQVEDQGKQSNQQHTRVTPKNDWQWWPLVMLKSPLVLASTPFSWPNLQCLHTRNRTPRKLQQQELSKKRCGKTPTSRNGKR